MLKPALHDDGCRLRIECGGMLAFCRAAGATLGKTLGRLARTVTFVNKRHRQAITGLQFGREVARCAARNLRVRSFLDAYSFTSDGNLFWIKQQPSAIL